MNIEQITYDESVYKTSTGTHIGNRGFRYNEKRIGLWILYGQQEQRTIQHTVSFGHTMPNIQDITPTNESGNSHGNWMQYWGNGNIGYKAHFINGEKIGLETEFNELGKPIIKKYYIK